MSALLSTPESQQHLQPSSGSVAPCCPQGTAHFPAPLPTPTPDQPPASVGSLTLTLSFRLLPTLIKTFIVLTIK